MEKKGYTLVSCLGRPTVEKKDNSYVATKYLFDDGTAIDGSVASIVLIEHYKKDIKKAIIIGTETSLWNAIIPQNENLVDLWLTVEEEINKPDTGITKETLKELERELSKIYGFEFSLITLPSKLKDGNLREINEIYSTINDKILKNTKLIVDVTNGYRYMPMMLFQTLQIRASEYEIGEVEMFYGELDKDSSNMRNVSSLWTSAEINKQFYAFESAFDGYSLGNTLIKCGEKSIGNWIVDFSRDVKSNSVYRIEDQICKLRNVLSKVNNSANKEKNVDLENHGIDVTSIIKHTVEYLQKLEHRFSKKGNNLSLYLLEFSEILYENNLTTQAIISLKEALYTHLQDIGNPELIGSNYSNRYNSDDTYFDKNKENFKKLGVWDKLINLKQYRNKIAHAGSLYDEPSDKKPESKYSYREYLEAVKIVFKNI